LRPFFDTAAKVKTTVIEALKEYLTKAGKVAIAYSGGVDSTFLLAMSSVRKTSWR
jgi:PP-loop superfamily ATP-utilizing enzyme